jgi:hydrogenase/urease accessory protein HupE
VNKPLLFGVALALLLPARLDAHDVGLTSIARIFLDQVGENRYLLSVVDSNVPPMGATARVLPDGCRPLPAQGDVAATRALAFECTHPLTFDDAITLPWPLAGVVVLARWSDGTEASAFFRGNGRTVPIRLADLRAGAGSLRRLAGRYFILGCEHILLGIDHLLFILGLLLLVHSFGTLVRTVTAFTLAHSLTLGAAVLGYVPVDRAPVEAAIALSIVLLAREIVMGHRGSVHLVHRQPWMVAFIFGLLHGLGFAGALGAIGLRSADIPLALLFFNLGVEAGQLAFVTLVLSLAHLSHLVRTTRPSLRPRLEPALGYTLGALAMLWLFHRLPAVLGS